MNIFVIHSGSDEGRTKESLIPFIKEGAGSAANVLILTNKYKVWKWEALQLLKQAQMVLFVVGKNSHASRNIGWELRKAIRLNKYIMFYRLDEDCQLHDALYQKDRFSGERRIVATEAKNLSDVVERILRYERHEYGVLNDPKNMDRRELMEQYKLFLQTSETLVSRRQSVNSFYISVNAAIVSVTGIAMALGQNIQEKLMISAAMAFAGLILDASWIKILEAYGMLNGSKMKIISILEKELPVSLYDAEWEVMSDKLNNRKYVSFTDSEKRIPKIFGAIYSIFIIISAVVLLLSPR